MPRNLPTEILFAKNKVDEPNAWLALLDIVVPLTGDDLEIYIVNNTENITFNGQEYTAFPFSIALPKQTNTGEIAKTTLTVDDTAKALRNYISQLNGGYGTTVKLRVVNSGYLSSDYADLTLDFDLLDVSIENDGINFTLGAPNLLRQSFPAGRYMSNHCMWTPYYGTANAHECKIFADNAILATYPTCPGTRSACRDRSNTQNFGGHPGLADSSLKLAAK